MGQTSHLQQQTNGAWFTTRELLNTKAIKTSQSNAQGDLPQPPHHTWHTGSHQAVAKLYFGAVGVQRFSRNRLVMASFELKANLKVNIVPDYP